MRRVKGRKRQFENCRMFALFLPGDLYTQLVEQAEKKQISMAEIIRTALREKFKRENEKTQILEGVTG